MTLALSYLIVEMNGMFPEQLIEKDRWERVRGAILG